MTSKQTDRRRGSESPATPSRTDRVQINEPDTATYTRRGFLCAAGSIAIISLLAGCTGDGNSGSDGKDDPTSVDEWLSNTDNYDGIVDRTGQNTLTVDVGPEANEYVFDPAAIRVDPGTTITWRWIGSGHHNVVATDGAFDSGSPETKATFQHTFESPGTAFYYCEPHESMGMKGAVIVAGGANENPGNTSNQSES